MIKEVGCLSLLAVFLTSLVVASGVSTPYADNNPLRLAPGESIVVNLTLQTEAGSGKAMIKAELTDDGGGIAKLANPDKIYEVIPGSKDTKVSVEVSIPKDVEKGGVRRVSISFKEVPSGDEGMVSLAVGFSTGFPVEIVGAKESVLYKPRKPIKIGLWGKLIIAIIVAAVIAWFVIKKKEGKKKR